MIKHGQPPYLEASTKGDKRFSAFCARIKAAQNQSIEELYQASKIFKDGSTNLSWKQAKGRQAVNMDRCKQYYSALWIWYILKENPHLIEVLLSAKGISDMFGQKYSCCQATELWQIRDYLLKNKDPQYLIDQAVTVIKNMKQVK